MLVVRGRKETDPLPSFSECKAWLPQTMEGNTKGTRVEASEGAGYEVIVEGEIHGGSFGGPERHKDWVH